MQYLSKAYNYYSGINPATLSGAIDVIVVRHVDQEGNETLSSSPFHVRFGKLQVLRAGEKRVTLKLPNNLPAPHFAPFSMKVGETGEAFFVFETDEDVPPDLLTSPVVGPTEEEGAGATHDSLSANSSEDHQSISSDGEDEDNRGLTQQPFGDTEKQEKHAHIKTVKKDMLDSDVLDLNTSVETLKDKVQSGLPNGAATPSSLLRVLPSIPFISSRSTSKEELRDVDEEESVEQGNVPPSPSDRKRRNSAPHQQIYPQSQSANGASRRSEIPNPVEASPGEHPGLPERDHKLSEVQTGELPSVRPGAGDGPEVRYGKGVVLDMAGYHSQPKDQSTDAEVVPHSHDDTASQAGPSREPITSAIISALTDDLRFSARMLVDRSRPTLLHHSASEPQQIEHDDTDDIDAKSEPDLSALSLRDDRCLRATSEPPETPPRLQRPHSPTLSRTPNGTVFPSMLPQPAVLDLAWDWGSKAKPSSEMQTRRDGEVESPPLLPERTRSESMPVRSSTPGRLKNVEENPYLFVLEMSPGRVHTFELSLSGSERSSVAPEAADSANDQAFLAKRVTFQQFIEDPQIVDDPALVMRYSLLYLSWTTGYDLLLALSMYRRALTPPATAAQIAQPLAELEREATMPARASGYGWSRWWRRGQSAVPPNQPPPAPPVLPPTALSSSTATATTVASSDLKSASISVLPNTSSAPASPPTTGSAVPAMPESVPSATAPESTTNFAKTLRLSSDQLKQLKLHPGPNTVQFSVTSSYSGEAMCSSRIFLWESTDQIVISDIDGTITKSDALGHLYAAIGRDWTHLGIARLYTDIANNGYRLLYLTSRAIGQADSTREYLRSIHQGDYRMPEGPVIMSPDRLMASLHREVIMRKPELFKMACLRDIQRLFGSDAKQAFFAGFGNRITDAMSYRSVGIETSKIYTIDSTGVVKTELLQSAGHKGSYILLNDLVNEVFPPAGKNLKPEFTDFNYWRSDIPDIPLPDLSPPSPALSARSDSSMSVLSKIIGRRGSKQPILPVTAGQAQEASSRPSSPLIGPAMTPDELSEAEEEYYNNPSAGHSRQSSMPGSFEIPAGSHFPEAYTKRNIHDEDDIEAQTSRRREGDGEGHEGDDEDGGSAEEQDYDEDDTIFDDDILAAGEMRNVPF